MDFILIDPIKGVSIITTEGVVTDIYDSIKKVIEKEIQLIDSKTGELNFILSFKTLEDRNWGIDNLFSTSTSNLNENQIKLIRGSISPEIKILNKSESRIKVLDYEQEKFAKRISRGHYMVSGIPGSGKTVILIARALFFFKENPDWNIKIVTYNKALKTKLESRLQMLRKDAEFHNINLTNLSISTFHKMASDISRTFVSNYATANYWQEELPQLALAKATPMYDAVLIDEYQDFQESWLRVCLAVAKKKNRDEKDEEGIENIFLAGDRLQSIYNPREVVWKNFGLKIQGRSKLLKHSYRSGKKHIEAALEFLKIDPILKKEVDSFYEGTENIEAESYNEEINFLENGNSEVVTVLEDLIKNMGYRPQDIIILAPTHDKCQKLYDVLPMGIKSCAELTKEPTDNSLMITTYHSSKGLETKICIMLDFDAIKDRKLAYVGVTRASEKIYIQSNDFDSDNYATEVYNMVN